MVPHDLQTTALDGCAQKEAVMITQRCLDYTVSVKTKEPIDEDIADKVRREINLGIWKTLDDVLPREINCIVDSISYSNIIERDKVLDGCV